MIRSTDGGTSWSTPVRVNQDAPGLGNEHYFPWITCDPETGDLSVIFYDDRNVSSTQCEVYCANSTDGGTTWTDFKVSDVSFTPTSIPGLADGYMGDYLGIAARDGMVYPVWPDNRTGTFMTYCSPYDLSPLPRAFFSASSTSPCLNDTIEFTDQSTKDPTSWAWTIIPSTVTFVNGTTPSSQNPQVQFNANDSYQIRLIASNVLGSDTLTKSNYISVVPGSAAFSANPTTLNVGGGTTFNADEPCNVTSFAWSFGSGAVPATASTVGPHAVTYNTPGFKDVSLNVDGNSTTIKNNYILVDAAYCAAGATTCDEHISNVTIGDINNSSGCTVGGYQKYTQYWTRVSPGISYPIIITNGVPYTLDQCRIWVDWNQDLDFSDAGETITPSGTPGGGPYTANITPPADAVKGATRMRIRIMYTGSVSACSGTTWGEVEDYTLYVGTPGLWEGGVAGSETDWNTPGNWDDGRVPTSSTHVVIPDNIAFYPEVDGSYSCNDLLVKDGATAAVAAGSVMNVNGNLTVGEGQSGVLTVNGGVCHVAGTVTVHPGASIDLKNGGVLNDND